MSAYDPLFKLIARYRALPHIQDPAVSARLYDVQVWQKERIKKTHATLFGQSNNKLMTEFFLNRIYGSTDFSALADQIDYMLERTHKIEKFMPTNVLNTAILAIETAVNSIELDLQLADIITEQLKHEGALTEEVMLKAYAIANQYQAREQQMQALVVLGRSLDKYLRSFLVQSAHKMAKGSAEKHNIMELYLFIGDGFAAIKPIDSAEDFLDQFAKDELKIVKLIQQNHPTPFA